MNESSAIILVIAVWFVLLFALLTFQFYLINERQDKQLELLQELVNATRSKT